MAFFEVGKLPPYLLDRLFHKIEFKDTRLVIGPKVGEDAAVLDMGDRYLVVKTDPITFAEERIGWYCVNVNANDIATMGAEPCWFLVTLLLPEGKTNELLVERIFDDILKSCQELGITLCGGHTEITSGLERPILVGQMLGEVLKDRLIRTERVVPGDAVLLTQGIAVEGTAILAMERGELLSDRIDIDLISRAKGFLDNPGISVVKAARVAHQAADIHGMHDPTEGGVATGLWELAQVSGLGLKINGDAVTVFPETQAFCELLDLDPWGLIASGSLLVVVDKKDVEKVISALSTEKIPCRVIGQVMPVEEGLTVSQVGKEFPLKVFERDELAKVV